MPKTDNMKVKKIKKTTQVTMMIQHLMCWLKPWAISVPCRPMRAAKALVSLHNLIYLISFSRRYVGSESRGGGGGGVLSFLLDT